MGAESCRVSGDGDLEEVSIPMVEREERGAEDRPLRSIVMNEAVRYGFVLPWTLCARKCGWMLDACLERGEGLAR